MSDPEFSEILSDSERERTIDAEIEHDRELLIVWRVKVQKFSNVIRTLRPHREDYFDEESFQRDAETWNDALRAQGIEPNDLA